MSSPEILVVGDHFILPRLMTAALREAWGAPLEIREASTPFPLEPFRRIAEVDEASGSEDEMIEALRGIEACVLHHAPLTEKTLAASPALKIAAICRGGPVNANLRAATERGVAVCYAPGRNATATAEHTVALLLSALRRTPDTHAGILRGEWLGDYTYDSVGFELEGATVGLVGFGAIGSRVARILRGFGARILVHDPYARPEVLEGLADPVPLDELLRRSRVVSIHARATAETKGMIGKVELASMPEGSVLVNCARGSLVDYDALCDALESGHLFAAAVDVFPEEPLSPGSRLRRTRNLTMTPHIAGGSRETAEKAARIAAGEVVRFLRGEPLQFCANPESAAAR